MTSTGTMNKVITNTDVAFDQAILDAEVIDRDLIELKNTIKMQTEQYRTDIIEEKRQYELLRTVNLTAFAILAAKDEKQLENTIVESMKIVGSYVNSDCIRIMKNDYIDDDRYLICKYKWIGNDAYEADINKITQLSYKEIPNWKIKLTLGAYVNGPISSLSPEAQNYFNRINVKSILALPITIQDNF